MTEEIVTLETAKLLREKGMFTDIEFPSQSIAQKWLRDIQNIHIIMIRNQNTFDSGFLNY